MKANELRIGNLVLTKKDLNKDYVITKLSGAIIDYIECESILSKPIQLTEEWLLKFGFKRHHTDYSNGIIYIKDVPNNNEFVWGVYPFELGSGFVINKSKKLKYVHQLQNLYFALTGEELTLNK